MRTVDQFLVETLGPTEFIKQGEMMQDDEKVMQERT